MVALESTIITHGMPFPTNLSMAGEVEDIIRARGAVPATVAILGGKVHVGLKEKQLEELAQCRCWCSVNVGAMLLSFQGGKNKQKRSGNGCLQETTWRNNCVWHNVGEGMFNLRIYSSELFT